MTSKLSVERHFSRAATTYNARAVIQKSAASLLAARIEEVCPEAEQVLDIGCGTGFLTRELSRLFPRASITATDLSSGMIECAKTELAGIPNIEFVMADARFYDTEKRFNLIASSSTLQWLNPLESFFQTTAKLLEPQGLLCVSSMLDGTLQELHSLRAELFPHKPTAEKLPSENYLTKCLEGSGLKLICNEVHEAKQYFQNSDDFLRSIRTQGFTGGALSSGGTALTRGELSELKSEYQKRYSSPTHRVPATYRFGVTVATL